MIMKYITDIDDIGFVGNVRPMSQQQKNKADAAVSAFIQAQKSKMARQYCHCDL
jgi:hypothetical protein